MIGTKNQSLEKQRTNEKKRIGMPSKKKTSDAKKKEVKKKVKPRPKPVSVVGGGSQGGILTSAGPGDGRG
jgi:hypothetical protein